MKISVQFSGGGNPLYLLQKDWPHKIYFLYSTLAKFLLKTQETQETQEEFSELVTRNNKKKR
jgi:hypothetical protein